MGRAKETSKAAAVVNISPTTTLEGATEPVQEAGEKPRKGTKASKQKAHGPVDPEKAREVLRAKVGKEFRHIVDGLIEAAIAGNVTQAKYLFEMFGLYPPQADEEEAEDRGENMISTLLKRLGLPEDAVQENCSEEEEAELAGATVK